MAIFGLAFVLFVGVFVPLQKWRLAPGTGTPEIGGFSTAEASNDFYRKALAAELSKGQVELPSVPEIDETLTIEPRPASAMSAPITWQASKVPFTFTRITSSNDSDG